MGRRKGWACLRIGLERWPCRMEWALQSTPVRRRRLVPPPLVQGQQTWVKPRSAFFRRMHHERVSSPIRKNIHGSLGHHQEKQVDNHARRILQTMIFLKFERVHTLPPTSDNAGALVDRNLCAYYPLGTFEPARPTVLRRLQPSVVHGHGSHSGPFRFLCHAIWSGVPA